MEVEVTEIFAPQAGKRPINFIVLKYFLLGMLFSNGIESILIIPKTLSLMEDNEHQLSKLATIYGEHDAFKQRLNEYSKVSSDAVNLQKEAFNSLLDHNDKEQEQSNHKTGHHLKQGHHLSEPKGTKYVFEESEEPMASSVSDTIIEYAILAYGIVTLALGVFAVFKENAKLLLLFIVIVAIGLVILFFSGLTLIVFMAILNDVIIALISFSYLQMLNAPVNDLNYFPGPMTVTGEGQAFVAPQPSYNVDLTGQSSYLRWKPELDIRLQHQLIDCISMCQVLFVQFVQQFAFALFIRWRVEYLDSQLCPIVSIDVWMFVYLSRDQINHRNLNISKLKSVSWSRQFI